MAKLSEKFTGQHIALFAAASSVILLNVIDSMKGHKGSDEQTRFVSSGASRYSNPNLSWYQRIFCRGYQRSINCGFQFLHPMKETLQEEGKTIKEGAPKDGVIVYRGPLKDFDPND